MRVLITGGSGLIGRRLTEALRKQGHHVRHLGRKAGERDGIKTHRWDIGTGYIDPAALEGVDRIVHLAGAGIADQRWSKARVEELISSRAASALMLLDTARQHGITPGAFVSAAGINYYGAVTSERIFTEEDPPADDTIGRISRIWEEAVDAWQGTCRVVKLRTPVVLSAQGGALQKLAAPVRWGLGAPLGRGRQWMPWVHLDDLVRIYIQALQDPAMEGAYNVNAGNDVRNAEMMRIVARVLKRPFFLPPVPGFLLRLALGEMASILLEGSRAGNARLLGTGFRFTYADAESALAQLLRR
jgi:uncharacterized protein (TIGR01777 family)